MNISANTVISKVTFVRPGVTTHSSNLEDYFMTPTVTINGNTASISFPTDRYTFPPGLYFMFVWDTNGTPSIAQEVSVK